MDSHRVTFGCSLPDQLLKKLDSERGLVPRTRYVEQLIEKGLAASHEAQNKSSPKGALEQ
jgi:metal-responsive CopG/Arc/MetJ family transcriptional regulator